MSDTPLHPVLRWSRSSRHSVAAVAAALALTACAGPTTPINASLKEFPQSVRIGAALEKPTLIAPVPPTAPQLTGGVFVPAPGLASGPQPPPAQSDTTVPQAPVPKTSASAAPCPKAGPATTPLLPAGPAVLLPPAAASYAYRNAGKHTSGGAAAGTTEYPDQGVRTVSAHRPEVDAAGTVTAFTYDVAVRLGAQSTVTSYRVVVPRDPESLAAGEPEGLYVTRIVTLDAAGTTASTFSPRPAMLVMPFPADAGTVFTVNSVDPDSGTTISYTGTVGQHVVVDACGDVIDTRTVTHEGSIGVGTCGSTGCAPHPEDATAATTFTAEYDIATQYGGLSVADRVVVEGLAVSAPFADELRGTINTVPKEPVA